MINKATQDLASRVRQLLANDRNAANIYIELSRLVDIPEISEKLKALAEEEAGHIKLDRELLDLIEGNGSA